MPAFIGAVYVPMAISLVYNISILFLVGRSLKAHKESTTTRQKRVADSVLSLVRIMVFLALTLGLTWSFSLLVIFVDHVELEYLFAILNTLQGFFIFLVHTVRSEEARQAWSSAIPSSLSLTKSPSKKTLNENKGVVRSPSYKGTPSSPIGHPSTLMGSLSEYSMTNYGKSLIIDNAGTNRESIPMTPTVPKRLSVTSVTSVPRMSWNFEEVKRKREPPTGLSADDSVFFDETSFNLSSPRTSITSYGNQWTPERDAELTNQPKSHGRHSTTSRFPSVTVTLSEPSSDTLGDAQPLVECEELATDVNTSRGDCSTTNSHLGPNTPSKATPFHQDDLANTSTTTVRAKKTMTTRNEDPQAAVSTNHAVSPTATPLKMPLHKDIADQLQVTKDKQLDRTRILAGGSASNSTSSIVPSSSGEEEPSVIASQSRIPLSAKKAVQRDEIPLTSLIFPSPVLRRALPPKISWNFVEVKDEPEVVEVHNTKNRSLGIDTTLGGTMLCSSADSQPGLVTPEVPHHAKTVIKRDEVPLTSLSTPSTVSTRSIPWKISWDFVEVKNINGQACSDGVTEDRTTNNDATSRKGSSQDRFHHETAPSNTIPDHDQWTLESSC